MNKKKIPKPITHLYCLNGANGAAAVYRLLDCEGTAQLSSSIRLSPDGKNVKPPPDMWLRNEGQSHIVTGLFATRLEGVYKGDAREKKDLILFEFLQAGDRLNVYYWRGYYRKSIHHILKQLKEFRQKK